MSLPRILSVRGHQQSDADYMEEPLVIPKKEVGPILQQNTADCEIIMIDSDNDDDETGETSKSTKPPMIELRCENSMELVDPVKLTEEMPPETKQAVAALCRNTSLSLQLLPNSTPRRGVPSSSNPPAKVAQLAPNLSRKVAHLVPNVARKVAQLDKNSSVNTTQLESNAPTQVVQRVSTPSGTKILQSVPNVPATHATQLVPAVPATVGHVALTAPATVSQLVPTAPHIAGSVSAGASQMTQFVLNAPAQAAQSVPTVAPTIAQFVLSAPVTVSQSSSNAPVTVAQFVLAPSMTKAAQSSPNPPATHVAQFVLTPPVTKAAPSAPNPPTTHVGQFSPNSPTPIVSQAISTAAAATIAQFLPMASSTNMAEFLPNAPTVQIPPMVPSNSLKVEQMITNAAAKLAQMGSNPTPANLPKPVINSYPNVPQMGANVATRVNTHTTIMHKRPNVVMVLPVNNTSGGPFKSPTICTLERIQNPNEINMIRQAAAAQRQKQTSTQNNVTTASTFVSNVVSTIAANNVNNVVSNVVSTVARMPKDLINLEDDEEPLNVASNAARPLHVTTNVVRPSNVTSNIVRTSTVVSDVARASNVVSNVVWTSTVASDARPSNITSNVSRSLNVMTTVPRVSNVTSDVARSSNVTINVPKTSNITSNIPKPSNVTSNIPKSSNVTSNIRRPSNVTSNIPKPSNVESNIPKPSNVTSNIPKPSNIVRNITRPSSDEKRASDMRKKLLHNLFMNNTPQKPRRMTEIHHVPWSDEKSQEEEFFAESQKTLIPLSREATVDPFGIARRALSLAKKAAVKGPQARVSLVDVRKLLTKGLKQAKNSALTKEQNKDSGSGSSKKATNHTRSMTKSVVSNMRNSRLKIVRRNSRMPKLSAVARIQARLTKALSSHDQTKSAWKAQCIVCKEKFNDKYEFHRHATLAHPEVQIVFCELCSDSFLTDAELKNHRLSYHKITVMKDAQGKVTKVEQIASTTFEPLETIESEDEFLKPRAKKKRLDDRRKASRRNRTVFETIPGHSQDSYRGRMMKNRAAAAAAKATASRKKLSQYAARRRKPLTKNKTRKTGYDYVDEDVATHDSVINKSKFKSAEIKKLIIPLTRLEAPVLERYLAKLATHPITNFGSTSENRDNLRTSFSTNSDQDSESGILRKILTNSALEISVRHENLRTDNFNVEPTSENCEGLGKSNITKMLGPKRVMNVGHFRGGQRLSRLSNRNGHLRNIGEDENLPIADEFTSTYLDQQSFDAKTENEMGTSNERESVIVDRGKIQKSIYSESDDSTDDDNWAMAYLPEVTCDGDDEEESVTVETSEKKESFGNNKTFEIEEASGTSETPGTKEVSGNNEESETNSASVSKETYETNADSGTNEITEKEMSKMTETTATPEEPEIMEKSGKDKPEIKETSGKEKFEMKEKSELKETHETKEKSEMKETYETKEKSEMKETYETKEKSEMKETYETREKSEMKETSGTKETSGRIEESSESKKSQDLENSIFDTVPTEISLCQDVTSIELDDDRGIAEIVKARQVIRKLVSKSSATSYAILENKREKNHLHTEKRTTDSDAESSSATKRIVIYSSSDESPQCERIGAKKGREIPSTRSKSSTGDEKSTVPSSSENLLNTPSNRTKSSSENDRSIERAEIEKSCKLRSRSKSNSDGETLVDRLRSRQPQTLRSSPKPKVEKKTRRGRPKLNKSSPSQMSPQPIGGEKRPRGRPRVNKLPLSLPNSSKLSSSVAKRPGRPRLQKSPLSQPKSSEKLSNAGLSEHGQFLKSRSSERTKFSTTKTLLNSTRNRKQYGRIFSQMPKTNDNIDVEEKQLEEKTDDEYEQIKDANYNADKQENDENSDEEQQPKGKTRCKVKQQTDKNYSPRETRSVSVESREKTYGSGKKLAEIELKSKRQQNVKRKSTKSDEACFTCKELTAVMKGVATQLAGKNVAKTAIKCLYCKRYFISMFHLEAHIEGKHLQCENKISCRKSRNAIERKFRKRVELDCEEKYDLNDDVRIENEQPFKNTPHTISSSGTNFRKRSLENSTEDELSDMEADVKQVLDNFTSQGDRNSTENRPTLDCALCDAKFSKSTEYVRHVREIHDLSKISVSEKENTKTLDENEVTSSRSNEASPVDTTSKFRDEIFEHSKIESDRMTDREYLLKQLLSDSDGDEEKSSSKKSQLDQESKINVLGDIMSEYTDKSGNKVVIVTTPHICNVCKKRFLRAHDLFAHSLLHVEIEIETEKVMVDCIKNPTEEKSDSDRHGLFSDPFADDRDFDDFPKSIENEVAGIGDEISAQLSDSQSEKDPVVYGNEETSSKVVIGVKRAVTSQLDETTNASQIDETIKKPRMITRTKSSMAKKRGTSVTRKVKEPIRARDQMKELMETEKTLTEENDADNKSLECTKCNRNFATRTLLNEHLFFLHDDTLKDTVLTGLLTPISGVSGDNDDGPRQCKDCETFFKWETSYNRHRYFHHGDDSKVHVCENCCKVLTSITMANVHICTDVASYNCRTCNETFPTGMSLRLHNSEKHIESNGPHVCEPCDKNFLTKAMLERHVRGDHKFLRPYKPRKGSPVRMATLEEIFEEKARKARVEREIKKSLIGPPQPPRRVRKFKNLDKTMDEVIASSDIMWNEEEDNLKKESTLSYDTLDEYDDESLDRLEDYNDDSLDIYKHEIDNDSEDITSEIRSIADRLDENDEDFEENLIEDEDDFEENFINEDVEDFTENLINEDADDFQENLIDEDENVKDILDENHDDLENLCDENGDEDITKTLINDEPMKLRRGGWRACRSKKIIEDEQPKNCKRYRSDLVPGNRRRGRPRKYSLTDEELSNEISQDDENVDVWRESTLYVDENEIHQCSLCLLYCLSRSTLRNHMAKIHSTTDEVCQLCQKMYPTGKLIRHMIEKHITSDEIDETRIETGWQLGKNCNEMDMELFVKMMGIDRLVSLYEYRRYADTNLRLTAYPCPTCDKKFPSAELYRYHYLLHHDTMCAVCNIEYKKGHDAARHKGEIHGSVGRYIWFADRTLKALTLTQNFAKFAERNFIDLITRNKMVDDETNTEDVEDSMDDSIIEMDNADYSEVLVYSTNEKNDVMIGNEGETPLNEDILYDENVSTIKNEDETTNVVVETNLSDENDRIEDDEERTVDEDIFCHENDTNEVETTLDQITSLVVENVTVMRNEGQTTLEEGSLLDGNIAIMTHKGQTLDEEIMFDENVTMIVNETTVVDENSSGQNLTIKNEGERTFEETLLDKNSGVIENEEETMLEKSTSFLDENISITNEEKRNVVADKNLLDNSTTTSTNEDESMLVDNATLDEHLPEITNEDKTTFVGDENPSEESAMIRNEDETMLVDDFTLPDENILEIANEDEPCDKMVATLAEEIETSIVADDNFWCKGNSTISEGDETMIEEDAAVLNERVLIANEDEESMDNVDSIGSDDFAEPDEVNMIIVVTDEDLDRFNINTRYPNIWGLATKISSTFNDITPKEVKDLLACHFERQEDFDTDNSV